MNQKKSVNGLANIAALLNRSDIPLHQPAPKRERRDLNGISAHTQEKIYAALPLGAMGSIDHSHKVLIGHFLNSALRDAYNLGHAEALGQGSEVERLLEQQYETRTRVTTPAVVGAMMEQLGMESMVFDLARMATVFERLNIQYTLDADADLMTYTVRPIGGFADAPLGQAWTDLDDDARAQVEGIEQAAINVDAEQFEDKS